MNYFVGAAMGEETKILLTLFTMFAAAKVMGEIFERLRQPGVAGGGDHWFFPRRHDIGRGRRRLAVED